MCTAGDRTTSVVRDVLLTVASCLVASASFVTQLESRAAMKELRQQAAALRQGLHADDGDCEP